MKQYYARETRKVKVTDNWHPTYDDSTVQMTIMKAIFQDTYYCKVTVFGADDFGVQMEFASTYSICVDNMYAHWKKYIFDRVPDGVNVEWFYEHGFYKF